MRQQSIPGPKDPIISPPRNAWRGERCGVWGRTAPIKPVRFTHSFRRSAEFFLKTSSCIGLSIDGPAFVHDVHRKTRQGKGTHEAALRGARLLTAHGISFHVIAVVSEASLDHADAIFDFFADNNMVRFGFNVEEQEGIHTSSSLTDSHAQKVDAFFRQMFLRQKQAGGKVRIREFDFALQRIGASRDGAEEQFVYENEQVRPFGILSVDWQGRFSTFSPEMLGVSTLEYGDFIFGRIPENRLADALQSTAFLDSQAAIARGVEKCRASCSFFKVCGGGAPANKYFENGSFDSTETAYCRHVIQLPVRVVLEDLEASLSVGAD